MQSIHVLLFPLILSFKLKILNSVLMSAFFALPRLSYPLICQRNFISTACMRLSLTAIWINCLVLTPQTRTNLVNLFHKWNFTHKLEETLNLLNIIILFFNLELLCYHFCGCYSMIAFLLEGNFAFQCMFTSIDSQVYIHHAVLRPLFMLLPFLSNYRQHKS